LHQVKKQPKQAGLQSQYSNCPQPKSLHHDQLSLPPHHQKYFWNRTLLIVVWAKIKYLSQV